MYKVENVDLTEQAYVAVRNLILTQELKPNQKLYQEKLAERLGISRTPLLSAFAKLEREMLLVYVQRRGYFVRSVTPEELISIYEIRLRLEPLGAYEAAKVCDTAQIERLVKSLEALQELSPDAMLERFPSYDYEFHSVIMQMSGNEFLSKMMSSFNLIVLGNITGMYRDIQDSLKEHGLILEALKHGDTKTVEKAMYNHIVVAKKRIAQQTSEKKSHE